MVAVTNGGASRATARLYDQHLRLLASHYSNMYEGRSNSATLVAGYFHELLGLCRPDLFVEAGAYRADASRRVRGSAQAGPVPDLGRGWGRLRRGPSRDRTSPGRLRRRGERHDCRARADALPRRRSPWCIRTKNRPLFLTRALDSVLAQTYEDWVGIVVNDVGDHDSVDAAVAAVADRAHGRFHVVHNSVSRGREAAMNTGIHASSSTFVVIHDDDDSWAPTFLQETVGYLQEHKVSGVATRTEVVYEHIEDGVIVIERRELLAADKHDLTLLDMIGRNYAPPISVLYRREIHDDIGDYDESLPVLADWDFMLRLLGRFDMGYIDGPPLAFWHHRPTSVGDEGNSSLAGREEHVRWDGLIRDRYLRADLDRQGGLGYLLYLSEVLDRDRKIAAVRGGHLAGLVEDMARSTRERDEEILRQLAELNPNMVSQNNRLVAQFDRLAHRVEELYHASAPGRPVPASTGPATRRPTACAGPRASRTRATEDVPRPPECPDPGRDPYRPATGWSRTRRPCTLTGGFQRDGREQLRRGVPRSSGGSRSEGSSSETGHLLPVLRPRRAWSTTTSRTSCRPCARTRSTSSSSPTRR